MRVFLFSRSSVRVFGDSISTTKSGGPSAPASVRICLFSLNMMMISGWILERRFPEYFSRPEVQLNGGNSFERLVLSDIE